MQAKTSDSRRLRRFCSFPSPLRRSKEVDQDGSEPEKFPSPKNKPLEQETSVDVTVETGRSKPQSPSPVEGQSLGIHNPLTFSGLALPLFAVDRDGITIEWGRELERLTGLERQSMLGSSIESVIDTRYCGIWRETLRQGFLQNSHCDLVLKKVDGSLSAFSAKLFRHSYAENTNVSSVLCILDYNPTLSGESHDQEESEETMVIRSENVLQATIDLDNTNNPIFGIDLKGQVTEWNDYITEITGYEQGEAFECSLVKYFVRNEIQSPAQDVLDNAMNGLGTTNHELQIETKSNEVRHLLVNAFTRRDDNNQIVGVVGVAQDVTEAVQRDKAVASVALELRQLIETAASPIFGIDVDGNVNEWNRRCQEITGYSKDETFDEPLVERFIAPSMRQRVQEVLEAALKGQETPDYELEFVSKSGESKYLLVNATTRRDPEYNIVGVVGVAQDLTEDRKQAAELRKMESLHAAQEAKVQTERDMSAYYAHELRNPLGAIDSALNAMPDDLPDSALTLVAGMQLCCSFMSSIMNNLLDVRKMEEGKMKLNESPLSLSNLLINVHRMLKPSVKKGVQFEVVDNTKGNEWVLGDEHRLQQVLTNVITNAIKYTLSGYIRIAMSWDAGNGCVLFECEDTGPGIPVNEQERMFQRFVQRGGAPGTGLGLAIAKLLVDLAEGEIKFVSDPSVKPGTTCVVRLPLKQCEIPGSESAAPEDDDQEGKSGLIIDQLKFLIIDDVDMNRKVLQRRLEKGIAPNCTITEASNGEVALEICGSKKFDVVIVDQYMEEAGGVLVGTDVVYAMRRMKVDSIIIGCSGNDLNREFAEAGADWVWQKPMPTNEQITVQLRKLLKERKAKSAS